MTKQHPQPPSATDATVPKGHARTTTAAEIGELIGRELKAMFDDVVAEPVPEKFRKLLDELERKSRSHET